MVHFILNGRWFRRKWLKTDCGHKDVYATLKLKEEEYNIINNNNIQIAPMYKIKNSKCNKCGKPYFNVIVLSLDDDVAMKK